MKESFKKDILRIYALIFIVFVFFSSVKCMYDLISEIEFLPNLLIIILAIVLNIGSALLIFSGRLKDKNTD